MNKLGELLFLIFFDVIFALYLLEKNKKIKKTLCNDS